MLSALLLPTDVVSGNLKVILALCHSLRLHFEGSSPKRELHTLHSARLHLYPSAYLIWCNSDALFALPPLLACLFIFAAPLTIESLLLFFSPLWPVVSSHGSLSHMPASHFPASKSTKPSKLSYTSLERDDMELLAWVGSTIHRKIPDYSRY